MRRAYLFWSPVSQPISEEDEGALDLGSTVIDHVFVWVWFCKQDKPLESANPTTTLFQINISEVVELEIAKVAI